MDGSRLLGLVSWGLYYYWGREKGHPMRSCLSWDGCLVPAQCCLHGLAICPSAQLLAQAGSSTLSSCPSVHPGAGVGSSSEPPRGLGQALGLLGEETQLGQRHLLPKPHDLPEHRLCCRQREDGGSVAAQGHLRHMARPLPWLWAGLLAGTLGLPSSPGQMTSTSS